MAKVHLNRLKEKYKGVQIRGSLYSDIVKDIIDQNTRNVQNKLYKMTDKRVRKVSDKISTREQRMVLPELSDVLPKRAIHVRKVAEKGKFISETLRSELTKTLRESLAEFMDETGEESMVPRRGATTGRINPKLVEHFEKKTRELFQGYTKKHPRFGMPSNVHDIAVTEIRSSVNEMKNLYTQRLIQKNEDDFDVWKTWRQNKHLSKKPRRGHNKVDKKRVKFNEMFMVPHYESSGGRMVVEYITLMRHPHDPNAPAGQVIGCNCDFDITIKRKPKRKK